MEFRVSNCVKLKSTFNGAGDKCLGQIRDRKVGVVTNLPANQNHVLVESENKESIYNKNELDIAPCPSRPAVPAQAVESILSAPKTMELQTKMGDALGNVTNYIKSAQSVLATLNAAREIQKKLNDSTAGGNAVAVRKMALCDSVKAEVNKILTNLKESNTTGTNLITNHGTKERFSHAIQISFEKIITDIRKAGVALKAEIIKAKEKSDEGRYLATILSEFKGGKRKTKRSKRTRNSRSTRVNARR